MKKLVFKLLLLSSSLFAVQAMAALIVNRSIITYENPAVNREDVVVINSDEDNNLYVQVDPYVVVNPGSEQQSLETLTVSDDPEFLVTPNRLVVPPGGRSIVRFLNLLPPSDKERIYRVNLIPITPPAELAEGNQEAVRSMLEVVVAYQILVIVLPANPSPNMQMSRDGASAVFTNTGNSNYLLTDGQQCDPANPENCEALEDHRVYSGNEWELTLPFDGPFTYKIRTPTGMMSEYFR